jgi:hypothetical protein
VKLAALAARQMDQSHLVVQPAEVAAVVVLRRREALQLPRVLSAHSELGLERLAYCE